VRVSRVLFLKDEMSGSISGNVKKEARGGGNIYQQEEENIIQTDRKGPIPEEGRNEKFPDITLEKDATETRLWEKLKL